MKYHEQLNIIFMRDNGPRHSIRMRRSRFYLWIVFFSCLPFLCILLSLQCWLLWEQNNTLLASVEKAESDYQSAELRAEKLEILDELLQEAAVPAREVILRRLAKVTDNPGDDANNPQLDEGEDGVEADGPGHEEFPVLDTGRVIVDNVQPKALRGHRLRIGVDLRNPENEQILSGDVSARLITADGEARNLIFSPADVGSFRIARFKRTVMTATVPRSVDLENAQIILEVKNQDGEPIYRNIYAVQQ